MKYQGSQSALIVLRNVQNVSTALLQDSNKPLELPQLFFEVIFLENVTLKGYLQIVYLVMVFMLWIQKPSREKKIMYEYTLNNIDGNLQHP